MIFKLITALSAITLEHCPPSAWNRVRHGVEYASHGQFATWRQGQGLEQQGEAAARGGLCNWHENMES